MNTLCIIS